MKKSFLTLSSLVITGILLTNNSYSQTPNIEKPIPEIIQELSKAYDQEIALRGSDNKQQQERKKRWFIKDQTKQLTERYKQEVLDQDQGKKQKWQEDKLLSIEQIKIKYPIKWFEDKYKNEGFCEENQPGGIMVNVIDDFTYGPGDSISKNSYCYLEDKINVFTDKQIISLFVHYDEYFSDWRYRDLIDIILSSFNENPEKLFIVKDLRKIDRLSLGMEEELQYMEMLRLQNRLSYLRFFIIASGSERLERLKKVILSDEIIGRVKNPSCEMLKLVPENLSCYKNLAESMINRGFSDMIFECTSKKYQQNYLRQRTKLKTN